MTDKPKSLKDCTAKDFAMMNGVIANEPGMHRVVVQQPKSLSEQLTELAEWMENGAYYWTKRGEYALAEDLTAKAAEVRAMAERVKGKVIAPVYYISTDGQPGFVACTDAGNSEVWGQTKEDALANLQADLDEED